MANEHMKRCSILDVIRAMQTEIIVKYIRMTKSGTLAIPNAGKDESNNNPHSLLMGMQICTLLWSTFGDFLQKTKHTLTIRSSNLLLWYFPKGTENLCPHKNLYKDVYCSFIHNCLKLGSNQDAFSR